MIRLLWIKRPICWIKKHDWKRVLKKDQPPITAQISNKVFACKRCAKISYEYPESKRRRRE